MPGEEGRLDGAGANGPRRRASTARHAAGSRYRPRIRSALPNRIGAGERHDRVFPARIDPQRLLTDIAGRKPQHRRELPALDTRRTRDPHLNVCFVALRGDRMLPIISSVIESAVCNRSRTVRGSGSDVRQAAFKVGGKYGPAVAVADGRMKVVSTMNCSSACIVRHRAQPSSKTRQIAGRRDRRRR
jgi:hypothetical protein